MDIQGFLSSWLKSTDVPILMAFILGLIGSIAPCNIAINLAASAYISRQLNNRWHALLASLLYALGRMISYTLLAVLIMYIGVRAPGIKLFLEDLNKYAMVPALFVIGILMLVADKIPWFNNNALTKIGGKVANRGLLGSFLLGLIFAFAFCPYSALIFFGVLIPMAIEYSEGIIMPASFSIAINLPVIIFGILLSLGAPGINKGLKMVSKAEKVIRIVVALIFIGVGIYYLTLL